jgi:hypothetical protein
MGFIVASLKCSEMALALSSTNCFAQKTLLASSKNPLGLVINFSSKEAARDLIATTRTIGRTL